MLLASGFRDYFKGNLKGKRIAIWGLAFKAETDDIRESPALVLVDDLLSAGATVCAFDPAAMQNVDAEYGDRVTLANGMYAATEGADALALMTEWHPFRRPDFARMKAQMNHPVVFDGRNIWDPPEVQKHGFHYQGIGRKIPEG